MHPTATNQMNEMQTTWPTFQVSAARSRQIIFMYAIVIVVIMLLLSTFSFVFLNIYFLRLFILVSFTQTACFYRLIIHVRRTSMQQAKMLLFICKKTNSIENTYLISSQLTNLQSYIQEIACSSFCLVIRSKIRQNVYNYDVLKSYTLF